MQGNDQVVVMKDDLKPAILMSRCAYRDKELEVYFNMNEEYSILHSIFLTCKFLHQGRLQHDSRPALASSYV